MGGEPIGGESGRVDVVLESDGGGGIAGFSSSLGGEGGREGSEGSGGTGGGGELAARVRGLFSPLSARLGARLVTGDSSSPSSSPKRFMNGLRSSSISEDMSDDRDNGYAVESRFGVSSVTVRVELLDMMDDCGVKEDVKLRDSRIMSRGV